MPEWLNQLRVQLLDLAFLSQIASILSVLLTAPTLYQLIRTKKVTTEVRQRVIAIELNLAKFAAIDDIDLLVHDLQEIQELHRLTVWTILPRKYSLVRKRLISLKNENQSMVTCRSDLQQMIQQFTDIEHIIEVARSKNENPRNIPALNKVLTKQADKLNEILSTIRYDLSKGARP